jgi:DNA-binding response OmpR family regulator
MARKIKVLVVEDEGVVAMNVKMALLDGGYEVLPIAISAGTALTFTAQYSPDVVLMDIRIKGDKDGIDTAALIYRHYNIPIIYTTAHYDEDTVMRAAETEHAGYLVKPYEESELFALIEKTVNNRSKKHA